VISARRNFGDLRTAKRGKIGAQLQFLKQDERRGRQGDPQLIGPEPRVTGAPEGEGQFQFPQAILTGAARAIDVGVDPLGRLPQIRDDKARTIPGLAWVVPGDFGFDYRPPRRVPATGLIGRLRIRRRYVLRGGDDRAKWRDRRLGVPREETAFPAMATTYSTPVASKWATISGSRSRRRCGPKGGRLERLTSVWTSRCDRLTALTVPAALPGRRIAATNYCRASSSKVSVATNGR
jgi:hypothetical protein